MEVARWQDVRARRTDISEADRKAAQAAQDGVIRTYQLAEARRRQARTQVEIAAQMGVSQARVSELERGDIEKTEIRTLRSYAAALGARLHVVVEFDDGERVRLA